MNHVKHTKMWAKIKINLPILSNLILSYFLWHISMTFHKTHCHIVINKKVADRVETSCILGPDPNPLPPSILSLPWYNVHDSHVISNIVNIHTHIGKYDVCIFLHSRQVVSYHTHNFATCFFFEIYLSWYK